MDHSMIKNKLNTILIPKSQNICRLCKMRIKPLISLIMSRIIKTSGNDF